MDERSALDPVEMVIVGRARDLGGFEVRRVLPYMKRRMVGPFIFLDQMGPVVFRDQQALDVRPHPHIGLATVTYLFDGAIEHRDSLGTVQTIRPGDVNWMTAGSGIAHSERTRPEDRHAGSKLFGLQSWVALPTGHEETAPLFAHHGAESLPVIEGEGVTLRVVAGTLHGRRAPVETLSDLFYGDATLDCGARLEVPASYEERAAYLVEGSVTVAGDTFEAGQLMLFRPNCEIVIEALEPSRFVILGGEPMEGPRHIWWNFVSSSEARIEQAKADWQARRFGPVPGETEFIPLPEQ